LRIGRQIRVHYSGERSHQRPSCEYPPPHHEEWSKGCSIASFAHFVTRYLCKPICKVHQKSLNVTRIHGKAIHLTGHRITSSMRTSTAWLRKAASYVANKGIITCVQQIRSILGQAIRDSSILKWLIRRLAFLDAAAGRIEAAGKGSQYLSGPPSSH
jgi:hypothetical protein